MFRFQQHTMSKLVVKIAVAMLTVVPAPINQFGHLRKVPDAWVTIVVTL